MMAPDFRSAFVTLLVLGGVLGVALVACGKVVRHVHVQVTP